MWRSILLAAAVIGSAACTKGEEDEGLFVDGTYRFAAFQDPTGTCGDAFARLYFGASGVWNVTLEETETGLNGIDHDRQGLFEGSGRLTCDAGEAAYSCDIFDGEQPQANKDATLYIYASASLRFLDDRSLEGAWTLDANCGGDECGDITALYGAPFPCDFSLVYTATLQPPDEEE